MAVTATQDGIGARRRRVAMAAIIAAVLVLPLVGMQVSDGVRWTGFDFAAAAVLLVGGALAYEMLAVRTADSTRRMLIGAGIVAVVLTCWAQGAVGIL